MAFEPTHGPVPAGQAMAPVAGASTDRVATRAWPAAPMANFGLAVLIIAFAFSFLDRVILSMLMVPIQRDMNFSDVQLALLHGFAFAVFYAFAGLPLGRLADTVSRKRLIAAGILFWSLCTASCGLARSFGSLFLSRVGVGVGEAALSPAAYSMLSDYYPPDRRARAVATYQLGVTGGSGIAYILGGLVIAFAAGGATYSVPLIGDMSAWRLTFFLVGLPGIAVALLSLTVLEPPRRETLAPAAKGNVSFAAWCRQNLRTIVCFSLGYSAINVSFNAIIAWGPTWMARIYGIEAAQIGMTLGLAMLFAGGIGQLLGGWRSDWLLRRGRTTAVFDTGWLCALLLVPLSFATMMPSFAMAVVAIAALLFVSCAAIGHAPSLIGQIAPNSLRGRVAALFLFALNVVGTGGGPFAVAAFTQWLFADPNKVGTAITMVAATGAVIGALLLCAGRRSLSQSINRLALVTED